MQFRLISENTPKGDQPEAIEQLVTELNQGTKDQVLLGITGSGKTFTIANVIEKTQRQGMVCTAPLTKALRMDYTRLKKPLPAGTQWSTRKLAVQTETDPSLPAVYDFMSTLVDGAARVHFAS